MNKRRFTGIHCFVALLALASPASLAAGPGLRITSAGEPFRWDNTQPIIYNLDQGDLGRISHDDAARMVRAAFEQWQQVETARLEFQEAESLDRDVTGANLSAFLNSVPSDVNPVIFDQDGSVTEAFFGTGAVSAFFAFGRPLRSTATGRITQGLVVLNGRYLDDLFNRSDPSEAEMVRQVARAIGLMLNVGLTDLNDELIYDGKVANNGAVPIMSASNVIGGGFSLTLDDRIAASMLYPSDTLEAKTGVIRGKVLLPDGKTGLQGIGVVARKVDDPFNTAVSAVSGATFENVTLRGSRDPERRGLYELRVPPGSYTLEFRPLRAAIGPLQGAFPLTGGARFHAATPVTNPAEATPVTVVDGQTTEVNFVAAGTAAPAPQTVAEAEPNDTPYQAPPLPPAAIVTGRVSPTDPGGIVLDTGGGTRDDIEDLYHLEVRERSVVTLLLQPQEKVDLDLYVFASSLIDPNAAANLNSGSVGTEGEALQLVLDPGIHTLGVTAYDGVENPAPSDYTLAVITTPLSEPAPLLAPVIQQMVIGSIGATSAEVRVTTDREGTADVVVAPPLQQFGDPAVSQGHTISISGLTSGTVFSMGAVSQAPGGSRRGSLGVPFRTADATPATGPAKLAATVTATVPEVVGSEESAQTTVVVIFGIQNSGGDATDVRLTALTASSGWKLAQPVTEPIVVGRIGTGGTAVLMVRLLRDSTGRPPLATVTGTGSATNGDGTTQTFTLGR